MNPLVAVPLSVLLGAFGQHVVFLQRNPRPGTYLQLLYHRAMPHPSFLLSSQFSSLLLSLLAGNNVHKYLWGTLKGSNNYVIYFVNNRNHFEGKIFLPTYIEFPDLCQALKPKRRPQKKVKISEERLLNRSTSAPASLQPRGRWDLSPTISMRPQNLSKSSYQNLAWLHWSFQRRQ